MTTTVRKRTHSTMIDDLYLGQYDASKSIDAMETKINDLERAVEYLNHITTDLLLYKEEVDKQHYAIEDLEEQISGNDSSFEIYELKQKIEDLEEKVEKQDEIIAKLKKQFLEVPEEGPEEGPFPTSADVKTKQTEPISSAELNRRRRMLEDD
jgi:predicted RNase H-like nuclease (RuvC/YqgF family)